MYKEYTSQIWIILYCTSVQLLLNIFRRKQMHESEDY